MSKNIQLRDKQDLSNLLKTMSGRRFVWRVINAAQALQHGFVPGDGFATAFHAGQRSIGLMILQDVLEDNPGLYAQMKEEYESAVQARQKEIDAQSGEPDLN